MLYSGDNDLWKGKSPKQVEQDFHSVIEAIRAQDKQAAIVVIGVKPSGSRIKLIDSIRETNNMLAKASEADPRMKFIDPFAFMLDDKGVPRDELFLKDKLHMNEKGYALWTPRVLAAIEQLEAADKPNE